MIALQGQHHAGEHAGKNNDDGRTRADEMDLSDYRIDFMRGYENLFQALVQKNAHHAGNIGGTNCLITQTSNGSCDHALLPVNRFK